MRRAPLAVFLVLFVATFAATLPYWDRAFLGRYYVDAWGTQWFYWLVEQVLAGKDSVGRSTYLFFPWGKDVYGHTGGNVLDAVLALPLRLMFGPVVGYNLFIVVIMLTNVWAMRRLVGELGASAPAAWLTGVLFAFNPYLLTEIRDGRPTQAMMFFALEFWTWWLRAPRGWKSGVWAGVHLALTGLTYWYYALLMAPAAIAVFLVDRVRESWRARILGGVVALAIAGPFAWGMVTSGTISGVLDVRYWSATTWSTRTMEDVSVGILAYNPLWNLNGFWVGTDTDRLWASEFQASLPVQYLLAGAGILFVSGRTRLVGLAIVLPSLLLAIGPEFLGVPNTPYLLLVKYVRVFQRLWWPARTVAFVQVGLAVLAAGVWDRLDRYPRARLVLVAATVALWTVSSNNGQVMPLAAWSARVPDAYHCIAKAKEDGAVLEVPYGYVQAHLYYQTIHGKPIFGGMIEDNPVFTPPEQLEFREKNTFVRTLLAVGGGDLTSVEIAPEDKAATGELGYRWVLMDKFPFANPAPYPETRSRGGYTEVRAELLNILGTPVYEDEQAIIWAPWGGGSPCDKAEGSRKRAPLRRRMREQSVTH